MQKTTNFVAIDFEYCTDNKADIYAVGIVTFDNGEIIEEYYTLIRPENNHYDEKYIRMFNIDPEKTANAKSFKEIFAEIKKRVNNKTVVAHNAKTTDMHCLNKAIEKNNLINDLNITWLDTMDIYKGKLNDIANALNLELEHHNPLSDAKVAGQIYNLFIMGVVDFKNIKIETSNDNDKKLYPEHLKGEIFSKIKDDLNIIDNYFKGKKVVLTGFKDINEKKELGLKLRELGADIDSNVGLNTNILITGNGNVGPKKLEKMEKNIKLGKIAEILNKQEIYNKLSDKN